MQSTPPVHRVYHESWLYGQLMQVQAPDTLLPAGGSFSPFDLYLQFIHKDGAWVLHTWHATGPCLTPEGEVLDEETSVNGDCEDYYMHGEGFGDPSLPNPAWLVETAKERAWVLPLPPEGTT